MADFPDDIFEARTMTNLNGLVRNSADTKNLYAEDYNEATDEITAIETILGTTPQGAYATVKAWLTALVTAIGLKAPSASPFLTDVDITDGNFRLKGYRIQSFVLNIENVGGTLKHRIFADLGNAGTVNNYTSKIANASATFVATPKLDSQASFANGGGILNSDQQFFIFDTAAQVSANFVGQSAVMCGDSTGAGACFVELILWTANVNGVTRVRPALYFTTNSGAARTLDTTNIASGKAISIRVFTFIL